MTRKRTDTQENLAGNFLLALGAALLSFSGHDPAEVSRRADSVATGIRRMRERFEATAEQHVKDVLGCKAPASCDCMLCAERAKDRPS